MELRERALSRRGVLKLLGAASGAAALSGWAETGAANRQDAPAAKTVATPGGTGPNPYWNSVNPYVSEPQKAPLLLLTDRPVLLETPQRYFASAFTPNEAFYVRWHLEGIPNAVDLKDWRLKVEGNVTKPLSFSLADLMQKFKPVSLAASTSVPGTAAAFSNRASRERSGGMAQWGTLCGPECGCASFSNRRE